MPEDPFTNLINLKLLDLSENDIETITRKMFEHNKLLEFIDLYDNNIEEIERDTFKDLGKLIRLNLEENSCIDIDLVDKTQEAIAEYLVPCHNATQANNEKQ